MRLWEILSLKENYLQEIRTRYPEQYNSFVSWLNESYGRWFSYYQCSILFLVFVLCLAVFYFRKKDHWNWASLRRICALLILSALAVAFTRYGSGEIY
jgi:hypothetical protein